ncbi:hypothetical protein Tco_0554972, partial [Tanacetum coccineum]
VPSSSTYEVGGPSTTIVEGHAFPLPALGLPVPSSEIEDLITRMGNLEYGHGQLGDPSAGDDIPDGSC